MDEVHTDNSKENFIKLAHPNVQGKPVHGFRHQRDSRFFLPHRKDKKVGKLFNCFPHTWILPCLSARHHSAFCSKFYYILEIPGSNFKVILIIAK